MKTNQKVIGLPAMATIVSAAQEWLKSDNRICSAIMKERVSNQTMLHYAHVGVPAMLGLCCMNVVAAAALFAWSVAAYKLAKKGGRA
ncbi:MAG: hypothetical protein IKJ42_02280 [Bacteroidaceae bacterium]|nr:hypothetical protein [Bacteroidaceae bacterium]